MAQVSINGWGIVLELDEGEVVATLVAGSGAGGIIGAAIGPALVAANVAAPIVAAITAAVVGYFAIEAVAIKLVDKGDGVYLTLPWPAIFLGLIVLIVPTTRPPRTPQPQATWSTKSSGSFGTSDPTDRIDYVIEAGAVDANGVHFVIRLGTNPAESSGWKKVLVMPDGQGSEWELVADGRGSSATNSLWAWQVRNGQVLTFRKAKFLGLITDVLQLGDLESLAGGSRVTFNWAKDQ